MPLSPAERRAHRDQMAQSRINPDTGQPFRNYNALDLWQRNQRAKAQGFTSRAQKRGTVEKQAAVASGFTSPSEKREITKARKLPHAWEAFLNGRTPTGGLAKEFNTAWNKQPKKLTQAEHFRRRALRARLALASDWDWTLWREDYDGLAA